MTNGPLGTSPAATPPMLRRDAMSTALARNWWLVALRGAFAILFGIVAFVSPLATLLTLAVFFAAYMLIDGITAIAAAVRAAERHRRWGLLLLEGLLDILVAVAAFVLPGSAILAFVYLVAAWALLSGGLMIAAAFGLHGHYGRWWLVLGGLVSLVFGVAVLLNPAVSAIVLTYWLGGYAVAFGVMLVILGLRLRGQHAASVTPG